MAETKRLTVPAAEEILGGYFPVLDHGFVSLVDYMGSDESIEHAARVSYGYGTRKRSMTRGLVRYLRRHRHTTPSEMVELKFHCAMPMFVARQWIRHRTACLAEGTEIYFDLPGGIQRRGNQLHKVVIEDLWARFQPTRNRTRTDKQRNPFHKRDVIRRMKLRQLNEDSRDIQHTRIVDVFKNGPKPVFRVILADGKTIEATRDHRFLFADGWQTLARATGLREQAGKAVWKQGDHYLHVNGTEVAAPALYRDREWLDQQYNLKRFTAAQIAEICNCSVHTIRKWIKVHDIATRNERGRFNEEDMPWNKGKRYILGPRELSDEWVEANQRSRGGSASNFWRGGVSSDRESIGRWTTQIAAKIHRRNSWTCQLCHLRANELHCHHIVPVWADPTRARSEENLTTLCAACHHEIAGDELAYVERLGGPPVRTEWKKRPRVAWNKLTRSRLVKIVGIEYVGEKETYDLEVEGPHHNFIANGIVTHNSVNEYSGRYSLMPLLFYTPEGENFAVQSASNRQGRADETSPELYRETIERWEAARHSASDTYRWLVGEEVARELARIELPLSTYTQWYWKIDLHNLFHFLTLRVDPHAQWEIQQYGNVMAGMLKRVAPISYEAWVDYEVCGTHMSHGELEVLRDLLESDSDGVTSRAEGKHLAMDELKAHGLSPREARELIEKLKPAEVPDFELDLKQMQSPEEFEARMREAVPGEFE